MEMIWNKNWGLICQKITLDWQAMYLKKFNQKKWTWGGSKSLIKINQGLSSILTGLHANCMQCMQAACTPVKMMLITSAFD